MSQISQPVRIILIGAVVFLAAWFTVLRPKGEPTVPPQTTTNTTAPPASTPQTGLGNAVESAKKVAGLSDAKTATTAEPATTPATGTKPTTSAADVKAQPAAIAAVPAEALAKLPKDVAAALKARKVLVLGVLSVDAKPWRPLADDDRYVGNALKDVNRYDGEVVVKRIALDKLSTYGPLVNDLDVGQSPSIVVIDRDLKGSVLTGYVDTVSINQVIADAHRDSTQLGQNDAYLHKINSLCSDLDTSAARWSYPTVNGAAPRVASYKRAVKILRRYRGAVKRLDAPKEFKGFKSAFVKVLDNDVKRWTAAVKAGKTKTYVDDLATNNLADQKLWHKYDVKANAVGATSCARYRAS